MVDNWNIFTSMKSLRQAQGREIITLHLFTTPPVRFLILFSWRRKIYILVVRLLNVQRTSGKHTRRGKCEAENLGLNSKHCIGAAFSLKSNFSYSWLDAKKQAVSHIQTWRNPQVKLNLRLSQHFFLSSVIKFSQWNKRHFKVSMTPNLNREESPPNIIPGPNTW